MHVLYVHVRVHTYTMLAELFYSLQGGYTPLLLAASGGHTTCMERLLSTPGINANVQQFVSWSIHMLHVCIKVCGMGCTSTRDRY